MKRFLEAFWTGMISSALLLVVIALIAINGPVTLPAIALAAINVACVTLACLLPTGERRP